MKRSSVWGPAAAAVLLLAVAPSGCSGGGASTSGSNQQAATKSAAPAAAATTVPTVTPTTPLATSVDWNTKETDAMKNGNIQLAAGLIKLVKPSDLKQKTEEVAPATLKETPWNYYGKVLKLEGTVGVAQDYLPGSDVAKVVKVDQVGELVLTTADSTILDYLHIGSTGDANVGDDVMIYGYPVGLAELPNGFGGSFTQVIIDSATSSSSTATRIVAGATPRRPQSTALRPVIQPSSCLGARPRLVCTMRCRACWLVFSVCLCLCR